MELKKVKNVGIAVAVVIILIWTLFPFYWTFVTTFKSMVEIYEWPPDFIPRNPTLHWWTVVWEERPTFAYYTNTIIVTVLGTAIALLLGVPAAWAAARYRSFPGRASILFTILSFRFLPPACVVIPVFIFARAFGLLDTHILLGSLYAAGSIPIVVWVLMSYFREIPPELEESYMIDGYSKTQAFFKVTLPLAKTGIIAVSLLVLAFSFGEFLFAAVLTSSPSAKTLPIGISEYMGGEVGREWNKIAAETLYGLLPLLGVFIAIRKHMVRGLSFGVLR